ncbi:MAG: hypothetical protein B6I19_02600 [Bacteroidetes bacterium 4572_114]|nr:MAG: hypothetical protein B6I19_02600 [Bacteroidetes bacterium 4572_114]
MNLIQQFISGQTIYSLGWTIIHSLWQILIIAVALRILLNIFKKASTNIRYLLSATSLVMILVAGIITFISIYTNYQPGFIAAETEGQSLIGSLLAQSTIAERFTFLSIPALVAEQYKFVMAWVEMNLSLIVMLWMAGIVFFMLKFTGNLFYVQRLKHHGTSTVPKEWHAMLKSLSDKVGVKKHVHLLESVFARGPMVIGHIKPVILLPAGLLFSMPVDQVEAIFAHELAHIRRKDYLINTLKAILEIVFFYHPALWWISSIFDEERELCCDDITISTSVGALALSKALVSAGEFCMRPTGLAPAFYKKHQSLFKRIRRMNTKKHQTQKSYGRPVAMAVILTGLIAFVVTSSFSGPDGLVNLNSMMPDQTMIVDGANNVDTPPELAPAIQPDGDEKKPMKITTEDGKTYKVIFKDGTDGKEIGEVWLDGKKVPESKWKDNEGFFVNKEKQTQQKPDEKEMAELKSKLKMLYVKTQNLQDELKAYKKELSKNQEGVTQQQKEIFKKMYYSLSETEKALDLLSIKLNGPTEKLTGEQIKKARKMMYEQKESLMRANVKMNTLLGEDMELTEAEMTEIKAEQANMKKRMSKWYPVLTKELTSDGIIEKGELAAIELSIEYMKVNDKKQKEKVHQKYLGLFNKMRGKPLEGYTPYAFIVNGKKSK